MTAKRIVWRHWSTAALALPLLIAAGACTTAMAQQGGVGGAPLPPSAQPSPSAPGERSPDAAGSGTSSQPGGSLSDKLSRSGGVIQPPADPDPGMHQPTPNPGAQSMPVIPPPGTPGGNAPDVKPK